MSFTRSFTVDIVLSFTRMASYQTAVMNKRCKKSRKHNGIAHLGQYKLMFTFFNSSAFGFI
jgi:hypothetical protein